jgi:hypothetical protein
MSWPPAQRLTCEKTEVDIIEHVFKGVQTDVQAPRGWVAGLSIKPWLGGMVASAVQVQVLDGSRDTEGSPEIDHRPKRQD